ncbi:MAG: hypothetical protein ABTQ29_15265 [Siculibacillus sp.]
MPSSALRRPFASLVRGSIVLALAGGLLGGCVTSTTMGDAGAALSGRTRLAPLKEAPPAGKVTVQMLPFTGLPVTIGDAIYRKFRAAAATAGIELVHRLEEPATWRIQGHMVALGQTSSSTVIYTWDIYDASGRPVHRIVGQELAGAASGDPWSAVDGGTQERVATRSVRLISAWLHSERR